MTYKHVTMLAYKSWFGETWIFFTNFLNTSHFIKNPLPPFCKCALHQRCNTRRLRLLLSNFLLHEANITLKGYIIIVLKFEGGVGVLLCTNFALF